MIVPDELTLLQESARQAAALLKSMGNERRLLILCMLLGYGHVSAGALAVAIGLSPSATSQHLARMRDEGLVSSKRTGTTVVYRIADQKLERIITVLKDIYCP